MLVDRLAYHLAINSIQNGGIETFFSESYYTEDNELFSHIVKTPEYKQAQQVVHHWMRKQEQA